MNSVDTQSAKPGTGNAFVTVVRYTPEYHPWAVQLLRDRWGSVRVVCRGVVHQADQLPGFVALLEDKPLGLVTYRCAEGECEIVSVDALVEGRGIGSTLLHTVQEEARVRKCRRLWLVTTNDNLEAQRFYERRGFRVAAVHRGAIELSRSLKPEIPETGKHGIPIRDEIEFELRL